MGWIYLIYPDFYMNTQNGNISGYRLSPQQRRLWSLHPAGDIGPYRALCAVLIEGELDRERVKEALEDVVSRHEILRTTFHHLPGLGVPVQAVNDGGIDWKPERDLRGLSTDEQFSMLDSCFEEAKRSGFEYADGRLLKASLIALAPLRSVLILGLPSVCSDGAGIRNLVREIGRSYLAAMENGREAAEPMQYADTAEYLAQLLESEETEPGREYWQKYYFLNPGELKLPDQNRGDQEGAFEPAVFVLPIESSRLVRIKDAVQRHGATLEAFLLCCWQSLLWRLTGQREFLIGAYFDGRRLEGLEGLPGLFGRCLPFHAQCSTQSTFKDILNQTDRLLKQFGEWQDYFSHEQFFGGAGGLSFFPVCFEFENFAPEHPAGGAGFSIFKHYVCLDRFNIKLSCVNRADHLSLELHYDPRLFSRSYAEYLASQLDTLLADAAARPAMTIDQLELLGDDVKRRLVTSFNETSVQYVKDKPVHEKVTEQAEKRLDEIAVIDGDQTLTYRELNARANRLAHYLQSLGVGPDVLVGLCLEPSRDMVVAILGILKAGGAYVPLDHSHPRERQDVILEDLKARVLITRRQFAAQISSRVEHLLILEEESARIGQYSDRNPASRVEPDNLAYIIYTSGSTGRPKGVMIPHRGLTNYLNWCCEAYSVAEGQGAPMHSSIAFDLTVTSLFPPLLSGKPITLVDYDRAWEGLSELFRTRKDFALIKITPSHLRMLNLLMTPEEVKGIARSLVIGGEALHAEDLALWRKQAPQTRIINEYGPTETVVGCCVYEIDADATISGAAPIGRPIANTQIYILDERMEPVPPMITGEIYIGGAGVARGYWKRPGLTAERFLPDPFGDAGARLYRTGDLGRYRADGQIEFLGRADHQVKFKGYRIELGEIEAVICEHEAVQNAVVEVQEQAAEKRLVAYVAEKAGAQLTAQVLQAHLKKKLPDYMVPQSYQVMERLPLTTNGKIDRQALQELGAQGQVIRNVYVAPRTPTEALLAKLWANALGLDRVGIYDNFFELGGDSILSIQIASRASKEGLRFPPRQIFRYSTIAKLAAVIEVATPLEAEPGGAAGFVPLTPIQRWFFEKNFADQHHWNQAIMFELKQSLDTNILEHAIQHLVMRHDALRLCFRREPAGWHQAVIDPSGIKQVVEVDFSGLPDDILEPTIERFASELQASLNLAEGSVLKAGVIRLGGREPDLLIIIIHHLSVDVVSWGILLDDLQSAYQQLSRGEAVHLAAQSTSFKRWAERLKDYANSPALRRDLPYWLAGSQRWRGKIPTDFSDGLNTEASARTIWSSLTEDETTALLQEVPKAYRALINDVLLSALLQAFSWWTKADSLLVDLENHGREEIFEDVHLSRTIGWFTCIFPLLLKMGGARTPPEILKTVKEQVRNIPNGGIGYGLLRYLCEESGTAEQLKLLPQAEICFNYVGRAGNTMTESLLFAPVQGSIGPAHAPAALRPYLIELNGSITKGQLRVAWTYSENLHHSATIASLAEGFNRALRAVIDHSLSPNAGGHTPSDFELSGLSQKQLDDLIAELSKIEGQVSNEQGH
jgi:amino acid adenylation domain-containing protein/non-ribosomal peptide synthase protein (TIGR01720 family)